MKTREEHIHAVHVHTCCHNELAVPICSMDKSNSVVLISKLLLLLLLLLLASVVALLDVIKSTRHSIPPLLLVLSISILVSSVPDMVV